MFGIGGSESLKVGIGTPGILSLLLLSVVVIVSGVALAAGDAPSLTIDEPADGDWFIDPAVTLSGTYGTYAQNTVYTMDQLGTAASDGVVLSNGDLVYTIAPYFADEFSGNSLNTTRWKQYGVSDLVYVENGTLILGSSSITYFPLVASTAGSFPSDMEKPWEAEFRFRFDTGIRFYNVAGGGITGATSYTPTSSHMATYHEHFEVGYKVYTNGAVVRTMAIEEPGWNTYLLKYDPTTEQYTAYLDGQLISTFSRYDTVNAFWFGCPAYGTATIYPVTYVDYARLWTYGGSWESEVMDLGGVAGIDGATFDWSTNMAAKGKVTLQAQVSADNETWGDWIDIEGRAPLGDVEGRYLRFRADFEMPYVKDISKKVTLSAIELDYHYLVEAVEYDHNGAGWQPIDLNTTWSFDLVLEEDENHLEVRVTDTRGVNNSTSIDLLLDTINPTGTMEIAGGDVFTGTITVDLALMAEDRYGIASMQLSYRPDFGNFVEYPYCETLEFTLKEVEGNLELYARFVDTHGLISEPYMDGIVLDTTAPIGTIEIDGGEDYTSITDVTLEFTYWDTNGIATVELANDEAFTDPHVLLGTETGLEWDLGADGDGTFSVYLRITDVVGNSAVINDSIHVYLPKAEGTVAIENGATLTNMPTVVLAIDAPLQIRARLMQISEDPAFDDATWIVFDNAYIWMLSDGDGEKTIYVRFEDFRGIITLPVSVDISVDTTAPTVELSITGGAQYVTSPEVEIGVSYSDDNPAGDAWISNSNDREGADPLTYSTTVPWTLPDLEGERYVYIWVMDGAGNIGVGSDTVHLATQRPVVTVYVPDVTNAASMVVDIAVVDPYGSVQVRMGVDADPTGDWMAADGVFTVDLSSLAEGEHQVRVEAMNVPGLVSDVMTATFELDTTVPTLSIQAPADGKKITQDGLKVTLDLQIDDEFETVEYRIDDGEWIATGAKGPGEVKMPGYGDHTIEVRAEDAAGNLATGSTTFSIEEEAPGPSLVLAITALSMALVVVRRRRDN